MLKYCNLFAMQNSSPISPVSDIVLSEGKLIYNTNLPVEEVGVSECENRIAAETVTVYPPGVPVIFEGERFCPEQTEFIRHVIALGGKTIGVNNGKIKYFVENN